MLTDASREPVGQALEPLVIALEQADVRLPVREAAAATEQTFALGRPATQSFTVQRCALDAHLCAQTISNRPAAPMPPPTHIVATTHRARRRLPSCKRWPTIRAPLMPYG